MDICIVKCCSGALRILTAGAGSRTQMVSLVDIAKWLACDADGVVNICTACGLLPDDTFVAFAQTKFQQPSRVCIQLILFYCKFVLSVRSSFF